MGRLLLFYRMQMNLASRPIDVARGDPRSVTAETPKLRYPVGKDAELLIAGRRRTTAEDDVATGQEMSDDEYLDLMCRRYGFEW